MKSVQGPRARQDGDAIPARRYTITPIDSEATEPKPGFFLVPQMTPPVRGPNNAAS